MSSPTYSLPDWAIPRLVSLSPTALELLAYAYPLLRKTAGGWALHEKSREDIECDTGMDRKTVTRAWTRLRAAGLVRSIQRGPKPSRHVFVDVPPADDTWDRDTTAPRRADK